MAFFAGATAGALALQTRQLRMVSTVWPPFTDKDGNARFALDLVQAALGRINVTTTTTLVEAAQFTPSLLTGPFDGSAAAWRDAERDKVLLFSEPYLENRLVLVGNRGADVTAPTLATLKGKRIAIVEGYAYGDSINAPGPSFILSRSEEDSIRLLLAGTVEYVLMDELVVQYILDNHPEEARTRLQLGVTPLLKRQLHMAVRRSLPDAASIVDRFNAQLRLMITDRTYHKLLRVNWIYADVDGDGLSEYIAAADQVGKAQPQRAYNLFAQDKLDAQVAKDAERYFFGGAVYNGWSSVPDRYKVDHLDRPDNVHPTARIFTFSWK